MAGFAVMPVSSVVVSSPDLAGFLAEGAALLHKQRSAVGLSTPADALALIDAFRELASVHSVQVIVQIPSVGEAKASGWLRVQKAAEILGVSESYVSRLARDEEIRSVRDGWSWLLHPGDVAARAARRKRVA